MMDILQTPKGMTLRQLKDWLADFPDADPVTGEPHEVYVETGLNATGPVLEAWPMNHNGVSGDVGLYSRAWDEDKARRQPLPTVDLITTKADIDLCLGSGELLPCPFCGHYPVSNHGEARPPSLSEP